MLSPKLSSPTARPPRRTVKLSHDRKVRSLAKKTLGSTRVGNAIRFPWKHVNKVPLEISAWNCMGSTYLEQFVEEVG